MAFDKSFSDEIKKEIAYKEYEIESYNQDVRLKTGEYIGNVAHIYDNVNDNALKENTLTGVKEKRFAPPTLENVIGYCREIGCSIDAQRFIDFYESKGWMIGKNKMKDWKPR